MLNDLFAGNGDGTAVGVAAGDVQRGVRGVRLIGMGREQVGDKLLLSHLLLTLQPLPLLLLPLLLLPLLLLPLLLLPLLLLPLMLLSLESETLANGDGVAVMLPDPLLLLLLLLLLPL